MKLKSLLWSMAAFALVGCSSEEDAPNNPGNGNGEPQFLTVNLVTNATSGALSRAEGDPSDGAGTKANYEDGLAAENAVTKVRFYFFDAAGNAANVKGGTSNYLDWTNNISTEDPTETPNVEKVLSATLVIQSPEGDEKPAQIVAIINPTNEAADPSLSITELGKVYADYTKYTTSGTFVMSNSTYANGTTKMMAVDVTNNVKSTKAEALKNPAVIYVERTVAKVRLTSNIPNSKTVTSGEETFTIYPTFTAEKPQQFNGKDVYVRFLGWNVTGVTASTRLVKEINPAWADNLFGASGWPWNWAGYHRSFWAVNVENVDVNFGDFDGLKDGETNADNLFQAQAKTKFDGSEWVYVNENASANLGTGADVDANNRTKVIIAAQLVDENGAPLSFAEYGGVRYAEADLLTLFAENAGLYKKEVVEGGTKFVKITADDLEIQSSRDAGVTSNQPFNGYYKSYVQLKNAQDGVYYPNNSETATALTAEQANAQLQGLGYAKVWNEGRTYYFFDIQHHGDKFGVVRNHIYDAKLLTLVGLGTPVYNPDEIIYPEKPTDEDEFFIAAQINILSWRVVNNNIDLKW